jgi:hypothetical protein
VSSLLETIYEGLAAVNSAEPRSWDTHACPSDEKAVQPN